MAITATAYTGAGSGTNAASYTTASFNFTTASRLFLLVVGWAISGSLVAPTVSGGGLTWVKVTENLYDVSGTQFGVAVYRAMGAGGTTGALTIAFGGVTQLGCSWALGGFDGCDTGGTNGSAAIGTTANASTGSGTTLTATLASASDAIIGAFGHEAQEGITAGSGFSVTSSSSHAGPSHGVALEFRAAAVTAADASWATASVAGAIAVGLVAAGGTNATVNASAVAATAAVAAPAVSVTQNPTVSPAAVNASAAVQAPAVRIDMALGVGPKNATFAVQAPTVTTGGSATVSPAAVAMAAAAAAPAVSVTQNPTVSPAAVNAAFAVVAPTVSIGADATVSPAALALTSTLPTPSVSGSAAVAPAVLARVLAVQAPAVAGGASVTPAVLARVLAVQAPTVTTGSTVSPPPVGLSVTAIAPGVTITVVGVVRLPKVEYAVEVFGPGASFGPGSKLAEVWDARNIRWSRYDRLPGSAVFTLYQQSPIGKAGLITPLLSHVRISRVTPTVTTTVFEGVLTTSDATADDVVWTANDYLALLALSRSGFQTAYGTKAVGSQIVSPEWALARGAANSVLGFVTTGTIEDPLGTDNLTVIKTNDQFGTMDQHRLRLFYDLSEMCRANTNHIVSFEISRDARVFTFLKNKGVDRSTIALVLNGTVSDYRYLPHWEAYRNDLASVAVNALGGAGEIVKSNAAEITAKGLRQGVVAISTLLGIVGAATEADQQQAVVARELVLATQLQPALGVSLVPGTIAPFDGWDICDRLGVEIINGADSITSPMTVAGIEAMKDDGGEHLQLILQPVPA